MKTLLVALMLAAFALPGCSFLSGSVEEDEAWAVRLSLDQVRQGIEASQAQAMEGAEAQAAFSLDRSSRWADLGARILLHQAAVDGTLTEAEAADAMAKAEEQRSKDRAVILDHLAAIRDLRVWKATLKAFSNVEVWTNSRLNAGETKRRMIEAGIGLKDQFLPPKEE